jgi:hypothetical protein
MALICIRGLRALRMAMGGLCFEMTFVDRKMLFELAENENELKRRLRSVSHWLKNNLAVLPYGEPCSSKKEN